MQRMLRTRYQFAAVVGLALTAASCTSSTSPASRALDGSWNTPGHGCLTIGLNLDWHDNSVSGSGGYRTDTGPVGCVTPSPLQTTGTVTVSATRPSSMTIAGRMTFDGGANASFTGTLVETGGARIEGLIVLPDGTPEQVTIYNAPVP